MGKEEEQAREEGREAGEESREREGGKEGERGGEGFRNLPVLAQIILGIVRILYRQSFTEIPTD
eukprot:767396-Hanusia_phi.AAC.4